MIDCFGTCSKSGIELSAVIAVPMTAIELRTLEDGASKAMGIIRQLQMPNIPCSPKRSAPSLTADGELGVGLALRGETRREDPPLQCMLLPAAMLALVANAASKGITAARCPGAATSLIPSISLARKCCVQLLQAAACHQGALSLDDERVAQSAGAGQASRDGVRPA